LQQCSKELPHNELVERQCQLVERQCELAGRTFLRAEPLFTSISWHSELAQPPGGPGRRKWELAFPHFQSKRRLGERAARKCERDWPLCKQSQQKNEKELPR
jgi:hypothetical protein